MANDFEMLKRAIEDSGRVQEYRPSTYDELKEYYKNEYGERGWIGAYAQAVTGSERKSGGKYLAARRSIEKYEKGMNKTSVYASGEKVQAISSKIPVKQEVNVPIKLTIVGKQGEIKNGVRTTSDRTINMSISPETATKIVKGKGGWSDIWDDYGVNDELFEDGDYKYEAESVTAA